MSFIDAMKFLDMFIKKINYYDRFKEDKNFKNSMSIYTKRTFDLSREKPYTVEAIQWTGQKDDFWNIKKFCNKPMGIPEDSDEIWIQKLQNEIVVLKKHDYVIKKKNGDIAILDKYTFEDIYIEAKDIELLETKEGDM